MAPAARRRRQADRAPGRSRSWPARSASLLLAIVIAAGFAGPPDPLSNFAPVFVLIIFWVGMAFASVLFGDVFRAFNPWRAARPRRCFRRERRAVPGALGRLARRRRAADLHLDRARLGLGRASRAPRRRRRSPTRVLTLAGDGLYGVETWTRRGEAFSVYFNLLSRLSIFETRDHEVGMRPLLRGLPPLERPPGIVAFVAVMIGTVTFDGLSQGALWRSLSGGTRRRARRHDRPAARRRARRPASTGSGWRARKTVGGGFDTRTLARAFVHSLVPIAAVYVAAHYLTFLIFEGQAIRYTASDPFGQGWDLFGWASTGIDYGVLSQNAAWYLQVALVVLGHVAALVLAHDRALSLYGQARLAVRSQYWMLGIMIGFTTLALWLLAQAGRHEARAAALAARSLLAGCGGDEPSRAGRRPRRRPRTRLVDFSKKPPFVNTLDIDPADEGLPADDQPRLLADRAGRQQGHAGQGHGRPPRASPSPVGTFLEIRSNGPGQLLGCGHPDNAGALPNFLGLMRSDDGGKTWTAVARMADADLHKIVLRHDKLYAFDADPLRDADLHRRRQDVHGGVHAARADDRLRGRPGRPRADHRLDRDRALPHRGRRPVLAPADAGQGHPPVVAGGQDALPRRRRRDDQALRGRRHALEGRRRASAASPTSCTPPARRRCSSCSATDRSSRPRTEAPHGAIASGPDRSAPPRCALAAPAAHAHSLVRIGGGEAPTSPSDAVSLNTLTVKRRGARTSSSATRPSYQGLDSARARPARSPTTRTPGSSRPSARPRRAAASGSTSATARTPRPSTVDSRRRCSAAPARTS